MIEMLKIFKKQINLTTKFGIIEFWTLYLQHQLTISIV
jgi:hypothetical protein